MKKLLLLTVFIFLIIGCKKTEVEDVKPHSNEFKYEIQIKVNSYSYIEYNINDIIIKGETDYYDTIFNTNGGYNFTFENYTIWPYIGANVDCEVILINNQLNTGYNYKCNDTTYFKTIIKL